jgi:hypothetical protein
LQILGTFTFVFGVEYWNLKDYLTIKDITSYCIMYHIVSCIILYHISYCIMYHIVSRIILYHVSYCITYHIVSHIILYHISFCAYFTCILYHITSCCTSDVTSPHYICFLVQLSYCDSFCFYKQLFMLAHLSQKVRWAFAITWLHLVEKCDFIGSVYVSLCIIYSNSSHIGLLVGLSDNLRII